MPRRRRRALVLFAVLAGVSCSGSQGTPDADELRNMPLWVSAGARSGLDAGPAWALMLTPGPGTQLWILPAPAQDGNQPQERTLDLELSAERWELLREVLIDEDLLGLPERLGPEARDRARSWIQLETGAYGRTVWLHSGAEATEDGVRRYARVFALLRGWAQERAGHPLQPDPLP